MATGAQQERIWSNILKHPVHIQDYDAEYEHPTKYTSGKASYAERNQAMINDSDFGVFYFDNTYKPPRKKPQKYLQNPCNYYKNMIYYLCISTGRGKLYPFYRKFAEKGLKMMPVDALILAARHNQSERSFSTLLCQAFFAKFYKNHETIMLTGTGGLCR